MQDAKAAFYDLRNRGHSLDSARKRLGITRESARRLERAAPQHFSSKRIAGQVETALHDLLLREGVSFGEAARRIGCCKRTVIRFAKKIRDAYAKQRGQVDFESRSATCPIHGKISVVPCVACIANASKSQSG